MKNSIINIAWNVSEQEYRKDPAISYSALSRFAREGHKAIPTLYDKIDGEALRFGSLVDTLITEPHTINEKFHFGTFPSISDTIRNIINDAYEKNKDRTVSMAGIESSRLLELAEKYNHGRNWKPETRVKDIIEKGEAYYRLLHNAGDKILLSKYDLDKAKACVNALYTDPYTKHIFDLKNTNLFGGNVVQDVELKFQLKFKLTPKENSDITNSIRCMFDILIVDHVNKTIRPIDLKTTGKDEDNFAESFLTWRYDIQSTMYTYILAMLCASDEYFKDFTILPFTFVCINRNNMTPLLWEDVNCFSQSFRIDNTGVVYKPWKKLLQELTWHLDNKLYAHSYDAYQNEGWMKLNNLKEIDYESI